MILCKNFNIQPSELERMPFWEYELSIKECEKMVEEEKKRQEEDNDKYGQYRDKFNPRSYQNQAQRMMNNQKLPSMPSMPKMPKL